MHTVTTEPTSTAGKVTNQTPRELAAQLDRYIIGQDAAKRAVALAVRNRWRRQQLSDELRQEVSPKNILMIGSTGVGKTEIARRLAKLTHAPFVKVEATKYTEVGYYGRDVESMVRDLVENAVGLVTDTERQKVKIEAAERTEKKLLDLLCPTPVSYEFSPSPSESENESSTANDSHDRTRDKMADMLKTGELENRMVEITIEQRQSPVMFGGANMDNMDVDLQGMLEKIVPKSKTKREVTVEQARKIILEQESESLLNEEKINEQAIEITENVGIIFLDEIDKVIASESKSADVSRSGVQRDLLPIVEGTTVKTKYGYVKTDHILFIAAGAFHRNQPSELMPELQGRFPIRVELDDLKTEDFVKILSEPKNSLTKQYVALMETEGVKIEFTDDAVQQLAEYAFKVNQTTQNIGARRLYTVLEHLLEELSFEAPDMKMGEVEINGEYVRQRLDHVAQDEDLSRYIL